MNDDARRMLDAIHVINHGTFTAGDEPPEDQPVLHDLHGWTKNSMSPIRLRNYQRAGFFSRTVAEAIEAGVLRVEVKP